MSGNKKTPERISSQLACMMRPPLKELVSLIECAATGPRLALMAQVKAIYALIEFLEYDQP